jgi:hypothetical protein
MRKSAFASSGSLRRDAVTLWFGFLAYLVMIVLFCVAWSRALPPPQNSSRVIRRSEQLRALRGVLGNAFNTQPDMTADALLKKLDRVA